MPWTKPKPRCEPGKWPSTIDQQASEQGYMGITTAMKLLRGEDRAHGCQRGQRVGYRPKLEVSLTQVPGAGG
jgi:ABC-type sugar transport system substrate-binding protein